MLGLISLDLLDDMLVPSYVLTVNLIPFFITYARDTRKWWALIPAGILALIGLAFLIAAVSVRYVAPAVLILAGIWALGLQFICREA